MNRVVINTLLYFIIISTLIILIFPIVWMLLTAFKSTDEIFKIPPTFLPKNFSFDAFFFIYSSALTEKPDFLEIYRYFRTIFVSDDKVHNFAWTRFTRVISDIWFSDNACFDCPSWNISRYFLNGNLNHDRLLKIIN